MLETPRSTVVNPAPSSYRSRMVYAAARTVVRPMLSNWPMNAAGLTAAGAFDLALGCLPGPRYAHTTRTELNGVPGEWVRGPKVRSDPADGAVLYFHGGAFLTCGLNTHRRGVARLSEASGLPVLSVSYRQLPAVALALSVRDCLAAYESLLDGGVDPAKIVLGGDSAGGYLVFATALAARDAGLPLPAGLVTLSPLLDFDSTARLAHRNHTRDAYIPGAKVAAIAAMCGGGYVPEPSTYPVNRDLRGLPPAMIVVAASEILRCDAELMAERLDAAEVPCTLQVWRGQVHAFPMLGHLMPESRLALGALGSFMRSSIDGTAPAQS